MKVCKVLSVIFATWVCLIHLSGCGTSNLAVQNAQDYLKALKEGNSTEAEKHLCPSASEELATWTEEVDFAQVTEYTCKLSDALVECTLTLGEGNQAVVTFFMEEEKVCGVESIMLLQP